jgi:cytochrome c-type biogenesis protein
VAYDAQRWLSRVGGVPIVFFGLYLTGLVRVTFSGTAPPACGFSVAPSRFRSRYLGSFVFGATFWLLLAYALGLGLPFLLVGLFTGQAAALIGRYAERLRSVEVAFGVALIILGVLVFTQQLSRFASFGFAERFLSR